MDKIVDIDDVAGLRERMLEWDAKLDQLDVEAEAAKQRLSSATKAKWNDVFSQIRAALPAGAGPNNFVLRVGTGGEHGCVAEAIYGQSKGDVGGLGDGEIGDIEDVVRTMMRSRG